MPTIPRVCRTHAAKTPCSKLSVLLLLCTGWFTDDCFCCVCNTRVCVCVGGESCSQTVR